MRNVVVVMSKDNFTGIEKRMEMFWSKFQKSVMQVIGSYEVENRNMVVDPLILALSLRTYIHRGRPKLWEREHPPSAA